MARTSAKRVPWLYSTRQSELEAYLRVADRMHNRGGMSAKQQGLGLSFLYRFINECRAVADNLQTLDVSNVSMVTFDQAVQAWSHLCAEAQWSPLYIQRVRTILGRTLEALDQPRLAFAINRNRIQHTEWRCT